LIFEWNYGLIAVPFLEAGVAKLADAPDLGSGGAILRGSSPLSGIQDRTEGVKSGDDAMIYRILVDNKAPFACDYMGKWLAQGSLVGAGSAGLLRETQLKAPGLENRRVRFFFTEKGWRNIGRQIVSRAILEGHVVRVIRQKNPGRSKVFYEDAYQVAILPPRLKGRWKGRKEAPREGTSP
jgi:hypothetical protein